MGVIDGTPVDAATTNPAFLDANADDTGQGKYTMANTDPISGPTITNIQREHNSIASFVGKVTNAVFDFLPTFTNNQGFTTAVQSIMDRVEELSLKFNSTLGIGHDHSGSGQGALVDALFIANPRLRAFVQQAPLITGATGSSTNVSSDFTTKTPSGGDSSLGVVVLFPNNKIVLQQGSGPNEGDAFVDGSGNVVFGRLDYSSPNWTLSYFVNLSGTETAYSFGSAVDVRYFYQEIYNPLTGGPVYSEYASIPSDNATQDVIDATATQRGLINVLSQTLGGAKTWNDLQTFVSGFINSSRSRFAIVTDSSTTGSNAVLPYAASSAVRLTNASLVDIQEISGPLAGGYFLLINETGADIKLLNNVGTVGNKILTGTGLDFTLKANAMAALYYDGTGAFWHIGGGGGGVAFSLAAFGTTPNADGATYSNITGAFNLEPADATNPGGVSTGAQTFAGDKTFAGSAIFQSLLRADTQTDSTTTGSNADLTAPAKSVLRLTNASLVSIQRILTMSNEQIIFLVNKTGNAISLINNFGVNGFLTGTGANLAVLNNSMVVLVFDSVSSRIMVIGGGSAGAVPTSQSFSTGTGTYTTAVGAKYIRVRMVGGGGGGGGSGTAGGSSGTAGTDSEFGTTLLVAGGGGGGGGPGVSSVGSGGTASYGAAFGVAIPGGYGGAGSFVQLTNGALPGGHGGNSPFFGGGGNAGSGGIGIGNSAGVANTGGGGGGASPNTAALAYAGSGGGSGGFVEAIITSPAATYSYTVGGGGGGGSAGTSGNAGSAGADGFIEVTEFY